MKLIQTEIPQLDIEPTGNTIRLGSKDSSYLWILIIMCLITGSVIMFLRDNEGNRTIDRLIDDFTKKHNDDY
jgi:hypothetical protein